LVVHVFKHAQQRKTELDKPRLLLLIEQSGIFGPHLEGPGQLGVLEKGCVPIARCGSYGIGRRQPRRFGVLADLACQVDERDDDTECAEDLSQGSDGRPVQSTSL
jgi:hypothetical protein